MTRLVRATALLLLFITTQSFAGQFAQGMAAANRGDYVTAFKIWAPLARRGNVKAQFNLGVMYHKGMGVARDDRQTEKWWHRAAIRGYAPAQSNLGNIYQFGLGVPVDHRQALRWYRAAARKGDVSAQYNLGFMFFHGSGVRRDNHKAMYWFRRAADHGNANACFNMGVMYEHGQGVVRNHVVAYALYNLIITRNHNGNSLAAVYRHHLAERLSPRAIRAGRALSKRLLRSRPMTKALDAYLSQERSRYARR